MAALSPVRCADTRERAVGRETLSLAQWKGDGEYLRVAFEEAEPGTQYVITRYRDRNCNLRTQLERIVIKAGLKAWPKLFQNLRITRDSFIPEALRPPKLDVELECTPATADLQAAIAAFRKGTPLEHISPVSTDGP